MPETPDVGQKLTTDAPPSESALRDWLGPAHAHWEALAQSIDKAYPGTFQPDWVFGGKKHGWGLRYKKSKSFCTLIPEYRRLAVQIVFGADEREKMEAILPNLPAGLSRRYAAAPTFHDGKWTLLAVPADADVPQIMKLLSVKRRPKEGA